MLTLDVMQGGYWVLSSRSSSSEDFAVVAEGRQAVGVASAGGEGYVVGGVEEEGEVSGKIDVLDGDKRRVRPWRDRQGNPI